MKHIRIRHVASGDLIAEGPVSLSGIMPFEGNYYISRKCLRTTGFQSSWIPGLCFYKFVYVWLNFIASDGSKDSGLGWLYWLPNPLFFFIAFRVAVPQMSPVLSVENF